MIKIIHVCHFNERGECQCKERCRHEPKQYAIKPGIPARDIMLAMLTGTAMMMVGIWALERANESVRVDDLRKQESSVKW